MTLRKVQDSAMMLQRDADMKKRILEAKQKYDLYKKKNLIRCNGINHLNSVFGNIDHFLNLNL